MKPKLSIITINRNNSEGLQKTIESVVKQENLSSNSLEYIVIDGASTDSSVEIINEYKKRITYWISEKDTGIYNAMNKGILKATGEYCLFLNSGDYLFNSTVISLIVKQLHTYDIISGALKFSDGSQVIPLNKKPTLFQLIDSYIPHPSTFIKTELLKKHPYSEDYKIISDYIFFFEILFFENATYSSIQQTISIFDNSGLSCTNGNLMMTEKLQYINKSLPKYILEEYKTYKDLEKTNVIKYGSIVIKSKLLTFITKVYNKLHTISHNIVNRRKA